jgi:hypothetical protein
VDPVAEERRLDLELREVEALREEGRIAGTRAQPGEARDGSGARRQEDARREHDFLTLRSGPQRVNPAPRPRTESGGSRRRAWTAGWRENAPDRQGLRDGPRGDALDRPRAARLPEPQDIHAPERLLRVRLVGLERAERDGDVAQHVERSLDLAQPDVPGIEPSERD